MLKKTLLKAVVIFTLLLGFSSCKRMFFPNIMFETDPSELSVDSLINGSSDQDYLLHVGDKISFKVFSNKGFKLLDQGVEEAGYKSKQNIEQIEYVLDSDGKVRLPILGKVKLSQKTVFEAERFLEEKFSEIIQEPYVSLKVLSWRVYVFKGLGGNAAVVDIEHQNTSLVEILAKAGGVPLDAKAYRIKVIRFTKESSKPQVYLVDFSSIEAMSQTDMQILSNDVIYIEPVTKTTVGLVAELAPYLNLVTALILVMGLFNN